MPTKGQRNWIQVTRTSKLASSFFVPVVPMVAHPLLLLNLPTCTPQRIRQVPQVLLNGEDLRNNNRAGPLLLLKRLARAGPAGFPMLTRLLSPLTLMKVEVASLSVVAQHHPFDSPALLRNKSCQHANRIPSSTDPARHVAAHRRRRRKLTNSRSLFLRHHLSLSLSLQPLRRLSDVSSTPTGVVQRLRHRHLLPTTQIAPTPLPTA
jgi:hypothetical protein